MNETQEMLILESGEGAWFLLLLTLPDPQGAGLRGLGHSSERPWCLTWDEGQVRRWGLEKGWPPLSSPREE